MYAMNSREFKNESRSGVFYGPPLYSIQIPEKNMKEKRNEITYKLKMVSQRENHEFELQNQCMQ